MVSESGEAPTLTFAEHCLIGSRQPDSADVLNVPNILQSCFVLLKNSYEKIRYVFFTVFLTGECWYSRISYCRRTEVSNPEKHVFVCSSLKREKKSWL